MGWLLSRFRRRPAPVDVVAIERGIDASLAERKADRPRRRARALKGAATKRRKAVARDVIMQAAR